MSAPLTTEQYRNFDTDEIVNYVVYQSTTAVGYDRVLQHKMYGVEMAHITWHASGSIDLRVTRNADRIRALVRDGLVGFSPPPSINVRMFLEQVRGLI